MESKKITLEVQSFWIKLLPEDIPASTMMSPIFGAFSRYMREFYGKNLESSTFDPKNQYCVKLKDGTKKEFEIVGYEDIPPQFRKDYTELGYIERSKFQESIRDGFGSVRFVTKVNLETYFP